MAEEQSKLGRHPLVQQNILDKVITYFSPAAGGKRLAARGQLALVGGYTGARIDKKSLSNWRVNAGSPTTDIIADLPMLRARSRDQFRNAPIAVGALNTAVSYAIGTGLSCTPSIDNEALGLTDEEAAEWCSDTGRRFRVWCESPDCDVGRRHNFYAQTELTFRTYFESGDAFVITPRISREGKPPRLALQTIEADRVCNPDRKGDTETLIDGIELSAETGETVAVHIARQHPGDRQISNTWQRVPVRGDSTGRRNVLHIFKSLRPGQVRGVPWIAPILEPLKQLSRYTNAELKAAVDSAIISVFVKMDPTAFQDLFDEDAQAAIAKRGADWNGEFGGSDELDTGKAVNLLPGEEIQTHTPGRPNPQFDPFVLAILRQIGVALELPYEVLVMHFQSSYTAARAALLTAWKFFRARRDHMVTNYNQPVFELWLADEVAEGRIAAPGFFANDLVRAAWCRAIWTGDGPGSIDPDKEVGAARKRVDMEISTLDAESILHDGIPWDVKHRQRKREVEAQKRDGTYVAPAGAAPSQLESTGPDDAAPAPRNGFSE